MRVHVHLFASDHPCTFACVRACALTHVFMNGCGQSSAHWRVRKPVGVYMPHTAAAGLTYSCQASAPTGCTATCGNAGVQTTTRTCISSAGQAVDSYWCQEQAAQGLRVTGATCVTSTTPCPAIQQCMHAQVHAGWHMHAHLRMHVQVSAGSHLSMHVHL